MLEVRAVDDHAVVLALHLVLQASKDVQEKAAHLDGSRGTHG